MNRKSACRVNAGPFQRIYNPSFGEKEASYINDHCFIRDDEGLWHMFGITHQEPMNPLEEKFFAHATAEDLLDAQWTRQPHVMHFDRDSWNETHVWAPHVIRHKGLYYMFYCAGGDSHEAYRIHLATSSNLWNWTRHPANPMLVDGYDGRDPMVLRVGDEWILYYTATTEPAGGHHVVAAVSSQDLLHWGDKRLVFVHPRKGTWGGPTESPFVVQRGGIYYLFVCTNQPYNNTAVYASESPFHWSPEDQVGDIDAHAAEVVLTSTGHSYISRAGWGQGGLYLAPLEWRNTF